MNKTSKKVPEIRFPGFTDDWEQRKFGEITTLKSASRVHREEWTASGVPFYRSSDVMSAINGSENEKAFISEELYEKLSSVSGKLEKGDVLVTGGGSVGNPYIVPNNEPLYTKDADLLWIKNQGRFDAYFIYEFFFSPTFRNYLGSVSHVGTIAHYTITQLSETPIVLPSLEEQQKIGDYFRNLDNLITLHQRKCVQLGILKKSMLQKMFPKKGETVPEIRFPGFTDDWEQRKVSGYASFLTGNGLNWNDITDDGKQECILYGNLYTDYGMIADKVTYRTNSEIKNPVYSEYGDVLIPASDTTPTGLARATSLEKSGVLLGGDINIIRPNEGINGSCLSLSLNANKKELIRLIKGTTVRHIHNSEIKDILICLPKDEDEQIKISAYFKQIDNLITLHQRKCDELKELKKCMLQKMFI